MRYLVVANKSIKINKWKQSDEKYIFELQKFLDRASNIEDNELKNSLIFQMLKCDSALTKLAEKMFKKFYLKGYRKNK